MKFTYPAVFHKTEHGTYEGYFPDLACCYAKGDTLDEALEDAIHSAYDWISLELTEEEPDFPPVSDVADLGKSEGEIARNIAVNIRLFEGWGGGTQCADLHGRRRCRSDRRRRTGI